MANFSERSEVPADVLEEIRKEFSDNSDASRVIAIDTLQLEIEQMCAAKKETAQDLIRGNS